MDLSFLDQGALKAADRDEIDLPSFDLEVDDLEYDVKGRNSRPPKRANHGARPCSSVMRKLKKKGWYHKIKDK